MSKTFNKKFKGIMRYLHITPKEMDKAVKILNEPELNKNIEHHDMSGVRITMHPSQFEDITVLLQRRWEEIEKELLGYEVTWES